MIQTGARGADVGLGRRGSVHQPSTPRPRERGTGGGSATYGAIRGTPTGFQSSSSMPGSRSQASQPLHPPRLKLAGPADSVAALHDGRPRVDRDHVPAVPARRAR